MVAQNEVRVNIRHNALILKTFSIPQLQAITGFNRQSIHSEIRRMEREELVSRVGVEARKKKSSGGRPPVLFQLTSDPEKRFELLQSVRAFYAAAEERVSELPRPASKHYFIAKEMLEESLKEGTGLTQDEKATRLDLIQRHLEYARWEEGVGEEDTQLIAASFDLLEAKAIDILAGEWEQAIVKLDEARRVCQQFEADDLVEEIQAYAYNITVRMVNEQIAFDDSGEYEKVEETARNMQIINHRFGDLPGISAHVRQAERLTEKTRREQISFLVNNAMKQLQRDLITRPMPELLEEQMDIREPGSEFLSRLPKASFSDELVLNLLLLQVGFKQEKIYQSSMQHPAEVLFQDSGVSKRVQD
jgi:hypothetical protein